MQVELNKNRVTSMAQSLRKDVPSISAQSAPEVVRKMIAGMAHTLRDHVPGMRVSKAYEAVSHMLGHSNWDTLSGLLKADVVYSEGPDEFELALNALAKPVDFYLGAGVTGDDSPIAPDYAKVTLTRDLLEKIFEMQGTAHQAGNFSGTLGTAWPVSWQNDGAHLRLGVAQLVVEAFQFHFVSYPKNLNCAVQTTSVYIHDLVSVLRGAGGTAELDFADNVLFAESNDVQDFARRLLDDGVVDINEAGIDKMAG